MYTHTHIFMCIYIYIYVWRRRAHRIATERGLKACAREAPMERKRRLTWSSVEGCQCKI